MSPRLAQLLSPAFAEFLRANRNSDVSRLLLGKAPPEVDVREAAEQLRSRGKALAKLPQWCDHPDIRFPPPLSVEQASSASTAAYKAELLRGEHLVDLTGGMGVDLLALQAGFTRATYVETDGWLCELFQHNAAVLGYPHIEVVNARAESFVEADTSPATFYLDPARRDGAGRRVFRFADCQPDVLALLDGLSRRAEQILLKAAPMIDLTQGIRELGNVRAVHVVSLANRCREVLFLLDAAAHGEPEIHCVNLQQGSREQFRFRLADEQQTEPTLQPPGRFVYDANAALRKAGAFNSVAARFGLAKLGVNTHLYTSDQLISHFPGRIFEVTGEVGRKEKRPFPAGRACVISRNHPLSTDVLRARYRLVDAEPDYLLAFRDLHDRPRLLRTRRVPQGQDQPE